MKKKEKEKLTIRYCHQDLSLDNNSIQACYHCENYPAGFYEVKFYGTLFIICSYCIVTVKDDFEAKVNKALEGF